ncbi:hypothetical protein KIMH_12740 [Bombiscardovia apis]|uniref:Uncharacterized protein n=2 Tax=Bombiscardovia apis TaxID=2932182 RepID=A0ABN6SHJ4_9BIFI|nr:hypothetical protein KIMH_12740 [Bombiscardovia apis]
MPAGDYENSWSMFKRCMSDKGFPELSYNKTDNGIYDIFVNSEKTPNLTGGLYDNAYSFCILDYFSDVADVYEKQVGNPKLYSVPEEAAVDCLHHMNLVPKNYTLEDFNNEVKGSKGSSFDIKNNAVQECLVPNGIYLLDARK